MSQSESLSESDRARLRTLSRRGFSAGAIGLLAGILGLRWIATRARADGIPWPLRRMLGTNQRLWESLFRADALAPEFSTERARMPRVNGTYGLALDEPEPDVAAWRLRAEGDLAQPREFTLAEIQALPRLSHTTELKCIEGWSEVVTWTGARFADFTEACGIDAEQMPPYVALETPGRGYYVGLDRAAAMHPQTLLCYEMNGKPLQRGHGAPLRLVIPVKYGIKNIKRIATIRFTRERPADYWAERGYDWYAGL